MVEPIRPISSNPCLLGAALRPPPNAASCQYRHTRAARDRKAVRFLLELQSCAQHVDACFVGRKGSTMANTPTKTKSTRSAGATAKQSYYMNIADAVRQKASCDKRLVGAVVVRGNRIVSTGYNGTPEGMDNCNKSGCYRCAHPELWDSGKGYDVCICVHAEQNALLTAARFGIGVEDADVYSTLAPCFGCMKELLQARIRRVYYLGEFKVEPELRDQLDALIARFRAQKGQVKQLDVVGIDPHLGRVGPDTIPDTGHSVPAT